MRHRGLATLVITAVAAVVLVVILRGRVAIEPPDSEGLPIRLAQAPPPTPLSDRFRGDVGGFGHRAKTLDALRPENRQAFLALANAEMFTSVGIYESGRLSRHVAAFRSLLTDPHCDPAFKELVEIGGIPGQLYGLSGTYFTDPVFFREAIVRFRASTARIVFLNGCNYGDETVGEVAKLIEKGLPKTFRAEETKARSNGHT